MNNSKPKITPALPRGMRDLLPDQLAVRYKVIETLRKVFELYGFQPLETPAMERLEILSGKGGEESDKLSFLVMKRGAEFQRALDKILEASKAGELNYAEAQKELADLGLRYDLTVPLARLVAMNQGKLAMPFKRYQIAPVWRAERPQHGRYREFTQCDVDIVGTDSPVADAEIIALAVDGMSKLGFGSKSGLAYELHINHRGLLSAIALNMGNQENQVTEFCIVLDKLDKIGIDGVREEMFSKGLSTTRLNELVELGSSRISINNTYDANTLIEKVRPLFGSIASGEPSLRNLISVMNYLIVQGVPHDRIIFDPTLARGLDYYTGVVFEMKIPDGNVGSVGGGGRYDGLVSSFSKIVAPAVGYSFGLDRIVTIFEESGRGVKEIGSSKVLVACLDTSNTQVQIAGKILQGLRDNNVKCELSYDTGLEKADHLRIANKRDIPFVVFVDYQSASIQAMIMQQASDSGFAMSSGLGFLIRRLSDGAERSMSLQRAVRMIKAEQTPFRWKTAFQIPLEQANQKKKQS